MAAIQWNTPSVIATALTTELDALANAALSAASAAIDNETDLYPYMSAELVLASLTPTGQPYCLLYLIVSLDGTNYEDLSGSATHAVVATFPMSTATAAKRIVVRNILIPPFKFKLAIESDVGPSLAASSNTLKVRRHAQAAV